MHKLLNELVLAAYFIKYTFAMLLTFDAFSSILLKTNIF